MNANIERLLTHLPPGTLARRLAEACRGQPQSEWREVINEVIADYWRERRGGDAS